MRTGIFVTLLQVLLLQVLFCAPARAQPVQATEAELKAAIIYGLTRYVDWPAEALNDTTASFNLCVLGNDAALMSSLSTMEGSAIKQRPLVVSRIAAGGDYSGCHILVVTEPEVDYFSQQLQQSGDQPILTVNGSDRFLDAGGIIGLFNENNKIRFDINLASAQSRDLSLSSNLLKLARTVRQ